MKITGTILGLVMGFVCAAIGAPSIPPPLQHNPFTTNAPNTPVIGPVTFTNSAAPGVGIRSFGSVVIDNSLAVPGAFSTTNSNNGPLSVKSFGAAGDGTTVDFAAIQSALNSGASIYLPRGTYPVTNTLVVPFDNQSIIADGTAVLTAPVTSDYFPFITVTGKTNVTIRGLVFNGKCSLRPLTSAVLGVSFARSSNCALRDCSFYDFGQSALSPGGSVVVIQAVEGSGDANNNLVDNCRFYDSAFACNWAIRIFTDFSNTNLTLVNSAKNNIVQNCDIKGFNWDGIEIAGPNSAFNRVLNCSVRDTHCYTGFNTDKGASWNIFQSCSVSNMIAQTGKFRMGFWDSGTPSVGGAPLHQNIGNQFRSCSVDGVYQAADNQSVGAFGFVGSISAKASGNTARNIIANDPSNANVVGFFVDPTGYTNCGSFIFSDNTISNVQVGLYPASSDGVNEVNGIAFQNNDVWANLYGYYPTANYAITNLVISLNRFNSSSANSILLRAERNFLVTGNVIRSPGDPSIRVNTTNASGIIVGNVLPASSISTAGGSQAIYGNYLSTGLDMGTAYIDPGFTRPVLRSPVLSYRQLSTNDAPILTNDTYISLSGNINAILPQLSSVQLGAMILINSGIGFTNSVQPFAGDSIDGSSATRTLYGGSSLWLVANGGNSWEVENGPVDPHANSPGSVLADVAGTGQGKWVTDVSLPGTISAASFVPNNIPPSQLAHTDGTGTLAGTANFQGALMNDGTGGLYFTNAPSLSAVSTPLLQFSSSAGFYYSGGDIYHSNNVASRILYFGGRNGGSYGGVFIGDVSPGGHGLGYNGSDIYAGSGSGTIEPFRATFHKMSSTTSTPTGPQLGAGNAALWASNGVVYVSLTTDGSAVTTKQIAP